MDGGGDESTPPASGGYGGSYGGGYPYSGGGGAFDTASGGGVDGGGYGGRGGGYGGADRGRTGGHDWQCPNESCGKLNFARTITCRICGGPPPIGGGDIDIGVSGVGLSYPPSYGAPAGGYSGDASIDCRGGGPSGGAADAKKQCDETRGDGGLCDNTRIYISKLPLDVTVEELAELFGSGGPVAKRNIKGISKAKCPWRIRLYVDGNGRNKGDAVLTYEDSYSAHYAAGAFNGSEYKGHKISTQMAWRK